MSDALTRSLWIAGVVGCLVGAAPPAFAYRPFDGTDAAVADTRDLETELGPAGYTRSRRTATLVAPALVLNVGIVPDLELVAGGANTVAFSPSGTHDALADLELDAKWVLRRGVLQGDRGPSIALETGALLPSAERDHVGTSLLAIASFRGELGTVHIDLGAALDRAGAGELFAGAILEAPASWRARPVAELFVRPVIGSVAETSGLLGSIIQLRDDVAIDLGVRLAHRTELTGELRAGVTWAVSLWEPARTPR